MAAEPTEEAISSFISFTNSTREQAISLLKANDLNSNKAINAYFESATAGPQVETPSYPSDQNVPSFKIEHSDPVPGTSLVAPPSRPPSRISARGSTRATEFRGALDTPSQGNTEPNQKLSLAEQEEHELQQAVAMSLNQNLGQQETGVTSTHQPTFGPATRDDYDEGNWSMTLFNSASREIIISPDPEDRKRIDDEPAFLRPSPDNTYLGALITILHSIPLAREALLLRNRVLSDYGHDSQWWNGQSINLPKIVTIHDGIETDNDWDDILYESQRLVAFLDSTSRAFGSTDALAGLRCLVSYDSEGNIGKYLEKWQEAAICADPGNQLATVFSSTALRQPLSGYESPVGKDFTALETFVEPEHGQTLYDVLDLLMWSDKSGEELDDVWLEHVADILTIKLTSDLSQSVDVKIPPVFYPDRYLASCRDAAREYRLRKLQIYDEISRIDMLISRFTCPKSLIHKGLTSRELLERGADAVPVLLNNLLFTPKPTNLDAGRLESQLRAMSKRIEEKLKELELRRQDLIETLRNHCKLFTEPSPASTEPPYHEYRLRGVCTEPHVIYVLRRCAKEDSAASSEWQWWRISFSTEDAKARQADKDVNQSSGRRDVPANADIVGYTARKVREVEVLHAAREESKSVVLVYASKNALDIREGPIPPPLQEFVNMDNKSFEEEFQAATNTEDSNAGWKAVDSMDWGQQGEYFQGSSQYQFPDQGATSRAPVNRDVNVFDYEVSSFDDDKAPAQEMQEKGRQSLLSQGNTGQSSSAMDTDWDDLDDSSRTEGGVKSAE